MKYVVRKPLEIAGKRIATVGEHIEIQFLEKHMLITVVLSGFKFTIDSNIYEFLIRNHKIYELKIVNVSSKKGKNQAKSVTKIDPILTKEAKKGRIKKIGAGRKFSGRKYIFHNFDTTSLNYTGYEYKGPGVMRTSYSEENIASKPNPTVIEMQLNGSISSSDDEGIDYSFDNDLVRGNNQEIVERAIASSEDRRKSRKM